MTGARSQWQIDQGIACPCGGSDDYCSCQNVQKGVDDKPAVRGDYRSTFQPPPISQIRFGPLLRQARGGLSLSKAAAKIGCTKAHLWEMEMGRSRNPTVQTLAGIASAYGLTVSYLAVIAATSLTQSASEGSDASVIEREGSRDEPLPLPPNHEGGR
ncbi:helix-turn-helix domain-containing protein [Phenylobacterium sp. 58.2.17]|uniref:helix-turn-helix domain-containing protein n=1 Tax=Phenylobacterium sp. 58.2.17 TaxID=2969306 RepID=UPI003A5C2879